MQNQTPESPKQEPYRIVEADFVISAPNIRICPLQELPEIAVAGRSNVGKSSLINVLCNRRNLAKTSSTPGKTRLINFFKLRIVPGDILMNLVDLPGYGYAKASKTMQAEWGKGMQEFLEQRNLQGIIHLIDSRHDPSAQDCQMREWILHRGLPTITALTKADKLKQNEIARSKKNIQSILEIPKTQPCILTSVTKKTGIQDLLRAIVELVV